MSPLKTKRFLLAYLTLAALAFGQPQQAAASTAEEWQNLFDGKTLKGWKRLAGTADYKVENGAIVGTTVMNSGNTFLVTEKEYGDFQLELDLMIESTVSNSGVQTRSHFNTPGFENKVYGRQVEVDPSARSWSGAFTTRRAGNGFIRWICTPRPSRFSRWASTTTSKWSASATR